MSEQQEDQQGEQQNVQPKKVSLADAVKKQLELKKKQMAENQKNPQHRTGNITRKSQKTEKTIHQRRRTGGS